jgi:5'-3' exonuclease
MSCTESGIPLPHNSSKRTRFPSLVRALAIKRRTRRLISSRQSIPGFQRNHPQLYVPDHLYKVPNLLFSAGSHPNDEDAHFRLSEEQIFTSIFAYVDHLFGKIKPQKLFFMAIDGVAPRAKMNQQRSRRFRTAKEAKEIREKALAKGEKLPDEKAFDSNCITPGACSVCTGSFLFV